MKATKKLIGASVALVAALAVSVGSTFAWFTTNRTAKVSGISANVTSGDSDLEVALVDKSNSAAQNWGFSLDLSGENSVTGKTLDAVTSGKAEGATDNGVSLYKKGGSTAAATDSYIEFYVAFRSKATGIKVGLGNGSTVTSEDGEDNKIKSWLSSSDYGDTLTTGNPIDAKAQNAMRFAFIPSTAGESESAPVVGTSAGVWDPYPTAGYSKDSTAHNLAKDYELEQAKLLGSAGETAAKTEIEANYKDPGYKAYSVGTEIISLDNTKISEGYNAAIMCIKIWIEGTDSDCLNNIFGDSIKIDLVFEVVDGE